MPPKNSPEHPEPQISLDAWMSNKKYRVKIERDESPQEVSSRLRREEANADLQW